MEINESKDKPKKKFRKFIKPGVIAILSILLMSHFVWKGSGSNEWELRSDEDGVRIWTLKTPGQTTYKFRARIHIKSELDPIVFWLTSPTTAEDFEGGDDFDLLEKIDVPNSYLAYERYVYEMGFPFGTLEGVILVHVPPQDPVTKKVQVSIIAVPNYLHPKPDIWRIRHLHDIWNITPLENGEVEIELLMDLSFDALPYPIFNYAMQLDIRKNMAKMRNLLKLDKNKNVELDYIKEVNEK